MNSGDSLKILAFDTSSPACSIALLVNEKLTFFHDIIPMQQAQVILPKINELLTQAGIKLNEIDAIAFGRGPGSFTGVRIAVSVAQGLAFASNIPLISISSLAAMAEGAYRESGWEKVLVAVDARMQEVYWGMYQVNQEGEMTLKGEEMICRPEEVQLPHDLNWFAVGNGWQVYSNQMTFKPISTDFSRLPNAIYILSLAKTSFLKGEFVDVKKALPVYLRDKVAIKKKKR